MSATIESPPPETANESRVSDKRYWAFGNLVLARLKEFSREPEAVFWVYGFPILMTVVLGIAFRNKPVEQIQVAVRAGAGADAITAALKDKRFVIDVCSAAECRVRLRTGKSDLAVSAGATAGSPSSASSSKLSPDYQFIFDPDRAESILARSAVDDALQRAAGRKDPVKTNDVAFKEPGGRYIDFLVPGLLGMSLMGGGLWGVGFVTVDMRIRKLLKRFLATPISRSEFLAAIMTSRMLFMIPEVTVLLIFARFVFDVKIYGSLFAVAVLIILGAATFSGLGLLVASRAKTIEAVSGLMNLVMLPMWMLSGIFFSSDRFPAMAQPLIKILPLTPLINALRAVMLDGASLASQWQEVGMLVLWGSVTFVLGLKLFRWT